MADSRGANESVPIELPIAQIKIDGGTQSRAAVSDCTIQEYVDLMRAGIVFPPVRVYFDGVHYWLTDGFQRLKAVTILKRSSIVAEIVLGTLQDAQWDSYSANSTHGLRRTNEDLRIAIAKCLAHPYASAKSNVELAKHLQLPEATLRRWRKRLSSTSAGETRQVTRNGIHFEMKVSHIGSHSRNLRSRKSQREMREGLKDMKSSASEQARPLITILQNWAFGAVTTTDCLSALERFLSTREEQLRGTRMTGS